MHATGRFPRLPAVLTLLLALGLLPLASGRADRPPLYVHFIDQTDTGGEGPAVNGLEARRRGPVFQAALDSAAKAKTLPPVRVTNADIHLYSPKSDEPRLPPGATLARVYLTQWSITRLGGFADAELLCRFFVEVVRDGHVIATPGPYLGRIRYDTTTTSTPEDRYRDFQDCARQAIDALAHDLPR